MDYAVSSGLCYLLIFISSCRSYEGGFGGEPNCEAHGGYTLCGVAALSLLGQRNQLDDEALLRWLVMRQMAYEGGFQVNI